MRILLHSLLPSTHRCFNVQLNPFDGEVRPNGTTATLPRKTKMIYAVAHRQMMAAQTSLLFGWLLLKDNEIGNCSARKTCRQARGGLAYDIWHPTEDGVPLYFGADDWRPSWNDRLCKSCEVAAKQAHSDGRKTLWEELPSYCGLSTWADLHSMSQSGYIPIVLLN